MNVITWLQENPVRVAYVVSLVAGALAKIAAGGSVKWYEVLAGLIVALAGELARGHVTPDAHLPAGDGSVPVKSGRPSTGEKNK